MLKKLLTLVLGAVFMFSLAACGGPKTKEDVVGALNDKVEEMKSYKVEAKLTINNGVEPQVYDVDIWHNKPSFYKVDLKNEKKNQHQMILRNNEGVFVLTPALNKSFRFQSDWPLNSSQAYLFESLVRDVVKDKDAKFKESKNKFVFTTKTNYQNSQMLPTQEIAFEKSSLAPLYVKIKDGSGTVLVQVDFSKVKFNTKFDKDSFDMKKNMSLANSEVPVSTTPAVLDVVYPQTLPVKTNLVREEEFTITDGKRAILTYDGEKSLTIVQEIKEAVSTGTVEYVSGEPVDLGFAVGSITESSLTFTYGGVSYTIASGDLTSQEMIEIAESMHGPVLK